ncbi:MAG: TetR/AcrR family transcriptional regulator [Liquorilactobacillus mali]
MSVGVMTLGQIERRFEIRELKKQDLLDAAENKFFKKGFDATSIAEIAKEAEFSKKTLYTYFDSKNQIYFEIMLRGYKQLLELIQLQLQESHPLNSTQQFAVFWKVFENFLNTYEGYLNAIIFFEIHNGQVQDSYKISEYEQLKKELTDSLLEFFESKNDVVRIKSDLIWQFTLGTAQKALGNPEKSQLILQSGYKLLSSMISAELS